MMYNMDAEIEQLAKEVEQLADIFKTLDEMVEKDNELIVKIEKNTVQSYVQVEDGTLILNDVSPYNSWLYRGLYAFTTIGICLLNPKAVLILPLVYFL